MDCIVKILGTYKYFWMYFAISSLLDKQLWFLEIKQVFGKFWYVSSTNFKLSYAWKFWDVASISVVFSTHSEVSFGNINDCVIFQPN